LRQITRRKTEATDARSRLVAAAVESFASKGFHGTTTRDIASAAGMSPAALYVHHKSKEDLLYLISRAGHEFTLLLVKDAVAGSDDPVEQLLAVVHGSRSTMHAVTPARASSTTSSLR
jgi:AcrR family transcriptional regulator